MVNNDRVKQNLLSIVLYGSVVISSLQKHWNQKPAIETWCIDIFAEKKAFCGDCVRI